MNYSKARLKPPSSRGLGHFPFTEVTGIRIPLGVITIMLRVKKFYFLKKENRLKIYKSWVYFKLLYPNANFVKKSCLKC